MVTIFTWKWIINLKWREKNYIRFCTKHFTQFFVFFLSSIGKWIYIGEFVIQTLKFFSMNKIQEVLFQRFVTLILNWAKFIKVRDKTNKMNTWIYWSNFAINAGIIRSNFKYGKKISNILKTLKNNDILLRSNMITHIQVILN